MSTKGVEPLTVEKLEEWEADHWVHYASALDMQRTRVSLYVSLKDRLYKVTRGGEKNIIFFSDTKEPAVKCFNEQLR